MSDADESKPLIVEATDGAVLRLIPEFDGLSTPVAEWLEKVELVCSLRGVTALETVIPLRLIGGAFAVYQQLTAAEKADSQSIKAALVTAFGIDAFAAYEMFSARKLQIGESVDVFLADLRKLARSFGGVSEQALACALVAGLPEAVRQTLRATSRMDALNPRQLLERARALMTENSSFACAGLGKESGAAGPRKKMDGPRRMTERGPSCFECGGANHLARDCLLRRKPRANDSRGEGGARGRPRTCYRCGATGHLAATCQGNEAGETDRAPAFSPIEQ